MFNAVGKGFTLELRVLPESAPCPIPHETLLMQQAAPPNLSFPFPVELIHVWGSRPQR